MAHAEQLLERVVQSEVSRFWRHVAEFEIRLAKRRKNPCEHNFRFAVMSGSRSRRQHLVKLLLHPRKTITTESERVEVDLKIEEADLVGEVWV